MSSRGINRERQVRQILEADGWVVVRSAGSLGPVDLVAIRCNGWQIKVRFVEVKSTVTAYSHFGPADRAEMLDVTKRAGASAYLAWWPKGGKLRWVHSSEWPAIKVAA